MSYIKRIANKDIKNYNRLKLIEQGIYLHFNDEDITKMTAYITTFNKDSVYYLGLLEFQINFPNNYPHSPPKLKYVSKSRTRIHPNLYVNGKVCLSILNTWAGPSWKSVMDITSVLLSIQSVLDSNPLCHEPGYSTITTLHNNYNMVVRYEVLNTLLYYNNICENFIKIIKTYLITNKKDIFNDIEKFKNIKRIDKCNVYNCNLIINYKQLKEKVNDLYNKF